MAEPVVGIGVRDRILQLPAGELRDEHTVQKQAIYLAIGVRRSGYREVLGIWIEQTEGATFWLRVMKELRNRGTYEVPDRGR